MTPFLERRRSAAMDAVFKGQNPESPSCCRALDRALQLLHATRDDSRAALVLIAITSSGVLADAIAAAAAEPEPVTNQERGRLLLELHMELTRARYDLFCADMIDNAARWERETAACRERVKAAEAEIERIEKEIAG